MNAHDLKKSARLRARGGARSALLVGGLIALIIGVSFVYFARNHSASTISATSGQQKDTWPPEEAVNPQLARVDVGTGLATPFGVDLHPEIFMGIGFSRNGKLYGQEGEMIRTCISAPEGPIEIDL